MSASDSTHDDRQHRVRRALDAVALITSIGVCSLLIAVAISRLLKVETTELVTIQTFSGLLFLPAYLIFSYAYVSRRRALAAVSACLIVCHVAWVLPEMRPATSISAEARRAPHVTLYSHNMLFDNKTVDKVAEAIDQRDADFVFLQEFSYRNLDALKTHRVFDKYPYKQLMPAGGPGGIATWSKYPLDDRQTVSSPGFPFLRSVADLGTRELVLWNVHIHAPIGGATQVERWKADLEKLRTHLHSEDGDVLVAGDFNSTWTHKRYRELLQDGYRDGHVERGRGYARSWPLDRRIGDLARGLIRIDHVIVSENLSVVHIEEDPGRGSDHRALYAQIALGR